ncbi:hypothetical protein DFH09DRAFT_1091408 [Mycena vulgaris]|nr:hypothetical protein DFH09DRAFT_1091408 [Mycena vulgaris]
MPQSSLPTRNSRNSPPTHGVLGVLHLSEQRRQGCKSDQGPATGAHKKLLNNMGKTDPPSQFKHLGGGMKKEDKDAQWELMDKKVAKKARFFSKEFWAKVQSLD